LNQNRTAQVKARFAGIVRDVKKNIGDKVKKGETLALIESNESLQVYSVAAPLDGIVIARNTNIGDVADADAILLLLI
jgi:cobalt-zinc-cadmium efflux system membrane fusion protein